MSRTKPRNRVRVSGRSSSSTKPRGRYATEADIKRIVETGELTKCPWCQLKVVLSEQFQTIAHAPPNCESFELMMGSAPSYAAAVLRFRNPEFKKHSFAELERFTHDQFGELTLEQMLEKLCPSDFELCTACNEKMDRLLGTDAPGSPEVIPSIELPEAFAVEVRAFVADCPVCSASLKATGGRI